MPAAILALILLTLGQTGGAVVGPTGDGTDAAEASQAPALRPTWDEIFRPPNLLGRRPSNVAVSADGHFTTYRWKADQGEDDEPDTWLADNRTGEARVLFAHDDDVSVRWTRSGSLMLVEDEGWYDLLDLNADEPRRTPLFEAPRGARMTFLDDRRTVVVSMQPDRALWIFDLLDGSRRVPAPGFEARGSWYEVEELAGRIAVFGSLPRDGGEEKGAAGEDEEPVGPRLHLIDMAAGGAPQTLDVEPGPDADLSPDGRWVALTRSEGDVDRDLIMADYLTERVTAVPVRDSLAGDPAPEVSLRIHDVQAGETFTPPLDGAERYYLRGTGWSPDGSLLAVQRVSDDFHVRQILVVDPVARTSRVAFSERDEAWIGAPTLWMDWSADGRSIYFTSERSGFNQVYRVAVDGGGITPVTHGDYEIRQVRHLDEQGLLVMESHGIDDPATLQIEVLDLATGGDVRLTPAEGWADGVTVSDDMTTVVYRYATLGRPSDLYARSLRGGEARRLSDTVPAALAELGVTPPEIIEYPTSDGTATVRAYLYRPEPFDPGRTYPAVMFVHGAGSLQQVRRSMSSYEMNMLFHHRLARQGFVVIDPDYRHSTGYGRDFRAAIHGFMGGKDLEDCVAGVDHLGTLGYVDTGRVGIYGGSYGGFMTLMALFKEPQVFAAGAALRSVTDWRVYNHWYTNPRLGHPETHAENYARSSPIDHAEGLQNPLLILHGMKDSNVFAQDSIRLIEKLIELGKDFDAMLYPSQGHGFSDPDSWIDEYKRIERLFVEELRPGS